MTRDVIEICRKVWSGDKVEHEGRAFSLPLPEGEGTGLGKPLKLMCKPFRRDIPVAVASIGPKNVEMTAELANIWQPIHFSPGEIPRCGETPCMLEKPRGPGFR